MPLDITARGQKNNDQHELLLLFSLLLSLQQTVCVGCNWKQSHLFIIVEGQHFIEQKMIQDWLF